MDEEGPLTAVAFIARRGVNVKGLRYKAGMLRHTFKHGRTDLLAAVDREDKVGPAAPIAGATKTQLPFYPPACVRSSNENTRSLAKAPSAHVAVSQRKRC